MIRLIRHKVESGLFEEFRRICGYENKNWIIQYIKYKKNIYYILSKSSILGFLNFKFLKRIISIKLYLLDHWLQKDNKFLIKKILQVVESKEQGYLFFSHIFNSVNILDKLKGIDYGDRYENKEGLHENLIDLREGFEVRETEADFRKIVDFMEKSFQQDLDYKKNNWHKLLKQFEKHSYKKNKIFCYTNNKIVGAGFGFIVPRIDKKYLYLLSVHPQYRRRNIAKHLLQLFLSEKPIKPCYLNVFRSNIPAVKFYKKMGFEKVKIETVIVSKNSENFLKNSCFKTKKC
ncbi:MAG: GNAT family N-acetyltransferase [Candidatus Cloacimonetes bacterium]|nr:GNAT family N-acetyltransferase [Candidatus Cloacimonadota bacterium]